MNKETLNQAVMRTVRRFYKDANDDGEGVVALIECADCEQVYNLYNPFLSKDSDDIGQCAICELWDLAEQLEMEDNHVKLC